MKIGLILLILSACYRKPISDMDALTQDVLKDKEHQGINIEITPVTPETK